MLNKTKIAFSPLYRILGTWPKVNKLHNHWGPSLCLLLLCCHQYELLSQGQNYLVSLHSSLNYSQPEGEKCAVSFKDTLQQLCAPFPLLLHRQKLSYVPSWVQRNIVFILHVFRWRWTKRRMDIGSKQHALT